MELSPQQNKAVNDFAEWFKNPYRPYYLLFGYAGTGKSTIANYIAETIADGQVAYCAPTGKAANVLLRKGCKGATTIHKMLYGAPLPDNQVENLKLKIKEARSKQDLDLVNKLLKELYVKSNNRVMKFVMDDTYNKVNAKLIIVDECSMVDQELGRDLLKLKIPILAMGDPGQLPPIRSDGFFTSEKPDIVLTEIHRQAKDNPIIYLAEQIRNGKKPSLGNYGDSRVMARHNFHTSSVVNKSQLIVGRNKTRQHYNAAIRRFLFKEDAGNILIPGDNLICLRNDYNLNVFNGGIYELRNVIDQFAEDEYSLCMYDKDTDTEFTCDVLTTDLLEQPSELSETELRSYMRVAYGYAITAHKSQGSQWNSVTVIDESCAFRDNKYKWLYTAVTRASEKVTLVYE